MALDLLHRYHLGVMLVYCRHVVWEFLRSGVWGVAASIKTSALGLRSELRAWYASRRQSHSTENVTQNADVTPSLFGSMEDPKLKTKAAETWRMLFLVHCLRPRFKQLRLRDVELSV